MKKVKKNKKKYFNVYRITEMIIFCVIMYDLSKVYPFLSFGWFICLVLLILLPLFHGFAARYIKK